MLTLTLIRAPSLSVDVMLVLCHFIVCSLVNWPIHQIVHTVYIGYIILLFISLHEFFLCLCAVRLFVVWSIDIIILVYLDFDLDLREYVHNVAVLLKQHFHIELWILLASQCQEEFGQQSGVSDSLLCLHYHYYQ